MYSYPPKKSSFKTRLAVILMIFLVIPILFFLFIRLEGGKPHISINLDSSYLGASQPLKVVVTDDKSGVKEVRATLVGTERDVELIKETIAGGGLLLGGGRRAVDFERTIEPKKLGLTEGEVIFSVDGP